MKNKFGAVTFFSLVVAVLGVVVPIAWDYYSGQKGISLTLLSHSQVISSNTAVEGLEISYKGMRLSSLSRMTFLVENTGNKPILESDVVSPIKIETSDKSNVLDVIVDSRVPNNLDLQAAKNGQGVVISFSLLNPGDKAFVSLLVDSRDKVFTAASRIAGVQDLNVSHEPPKTLTVWAVLWIPVALLSLILILASLVGFNQYPQEVRVKKAIRSGQFTIPSFSSYEEAHEWVKKVTNFITSTNRAPIFDVLKQLEDGGSGFDKELILRAVERAVLNSSNNLIMALVVSFVGVFGLYYALSSMGYL
jgi:hypothetical protein